MFPAPEVTEERNHHPGGRENRAPRRHAGFASGERIEILAKLHPLAPGPVSGPALILPYIPGASLSGHGGADATQASFTANCRKQGSDGLFGARITARCIAAIFGGMRPAAPSSELTVRAHFPAPVLSSASPTGTTLLPRHSAPGHTGGKP